MKVHQGEIVYAPVKLPQGIEPHPVLVLSNDYTNDFEQSFTAVMITNSGYNDEYTYRLNTEMIRTGTCTGQIRLHLLAGYFFDEIHERLGAIKKEYLQEVIENLNNIIFDPDFEG